MAAFSVDPASGALTCSTGSRPSARNPPTSRTMAPNARCWWPTRRRPVVVYPVAADSSLGPPSDVRTTGVNPHAVVFDRSNGSSSSPTSVRTRFPGSGSTPPGESRRERSAQRSRWRPAPSRVASRSTPAGHSPARCRRWVPRRRLRRRRRDGKALSDGLDADAAAASVAGVDTGSNVVVSPCGSSSTAGTAGSIASSSARSTAAAADPRRSRGRAREDAARAGHRRQRDDPARREPALRHDRRVPRRSSAPHPAPSRDDRGGGLALLGGRGHVSRERLTSARRAPRLKSCNQSNPVTSAGTSRR